MGRLSVGLTTMAYSSVRVQFEIGHEASVRTKKTPEGFTHDWEVFVRGADNTDIQCFVDKVVFHLHETFPKPRRVIKEPPYVVKESGYAGFVLPIDVYLKNKEEPKKISFQYDLTLQSSGPPISRVLREPRLFQNPSEDFRRKLIRGGGVGVDTPSEPSLDEIKSASSVTQNKLKPAESPAKKHKPDLSSNHSFAELFGTPIRRVQEPKKLPEPTSKKVDDKKKTNKPYKEEKEKYLEREKTKEKIKKPPSPSLPPPPAPPQVKPKEEHKKYEEREKKKEEEKKKRKDEKEKKEKAKEPERQQEREMKKEKKETKDGEFVKKMNSKPSDLKPYYEQKHNNESLDREKERLEKEKHKHRHKKKEKEKNREKEKHRKEKDSKEKEKEKIERKKLEDIREKEEKRRKSRSPSPPVQIKKGPLNALLDELGSSDSASPLSEEESIPSIKPIVKTPAKTVPETKPPAISTPKPKSTNSVEPTPKTDDSNTNKTKKEKVPSKKSKKSEKDLEKKKEKEEPRARSVSSERERLEREEEVEKEKANKEERLDKEKQEEDKQKSKKRKREKSEEKQTKIVKKNETSQSVAVEGSDGTTEELRKSDKFTKEYVAQLRDLQHRIMTLEDNAELQKVVKVIAETGQYEVTKKTFDFDLCALDLETVKRLQEFFSPT